MHRAVGFAVSAVLAFATSAEAETMAPEQMVAVIQRLQSRVEALEIRSRQDRADAAAAKAELRAIRDDRQARQRKLLSQAPTVYAAASAAPPVALITKDAPALVPTASPMSKFDGFYAAAFGGYQFGTDKQLPGNGFFSFANIDAVKGGNVGLAGGYNITSGSLLLGFEARARKEFDETVARGDSGIDIRSFPVLLFTGCCASTPGRRDLRPGEAGDITVVSRYLSRNAIKREYGADVSARLGMIFDDTMLYMRIGAGANTLYETNRYDSSGTLTCVSPTGYVETNALGYSRGYATGCGSTNSGTVFRQTSNQIQPYGILGLGVEHNYGPYFARLEGAVMGHFPASGRVVFDPYYTTEVTGAVGVRF